jgi:hypothetical protein
LYSHSFQRDSEQQGATTKSDATHQVIICIQSLKVNLEKGDANKLATTSTLKLITAAAAAINTNTTTQAN